MSWTAFRKWYYEYFIVLAIALIISILVGSSLVFDAGALLWMASTVAQAFGALMAIVIAIGLFEKERNAERFSELVKEKVIRIHSKGIGVRGGKKRHEEVVKLFQDQEHLWPRLYYPLQSMAVLIAVSLSAIMYAKIPAIMNGYVKCFFFMFLFLFSVYTLETLLSEIRRTFIPS